tara:strand:- start:858 stop:959 length:102 start_codon:yes stop_codon:yes gene_type:complete
MNKIKGFKPYGDCVVIELCEKKMVELMMECEFK